MEWYVWSGIVFVALWLLSVAFEPPHRKKRDSTATPHRKMPCRQLVAKQAPTTDNSLFEKDIYRIAGITFHCKPSDVGGFYGTVEPQPDNPHDPGALAIYRDDGKQLGYIPAADLQRFKKRFGSIDGGRLFLIGFIAVDTQAPVYGRVLVLSGDSPHEDRRRQKAFVEWVIARHGRDFTPRRFDYISEYE